MQYLQKLKLHAWGLFRLRNPMELDRTNFYLSEFRRRIRLEVDLALSFARSVLG